MELLQPLGLIALASAPLIVALYFLRQRRPPRRVGSLLLWRRARNRVHRGRPWEKFRPSLLLLLQLLAAALIALALARPACVSTGLEVERMVLILDASASMAAEDVAPNRWSVAVARARDTIESAPPGSEIAILRAGHVTRVLEPTQDRARLLSRLEELGRHGPDATPGALKEAFLIALQLQSARGGGDPGQLVLFSDGAFDASELPGVGERLTWVGVGERAANLAITTFELRQAVHQRFSTTAIVTVTNTGDVALEGHLDVQLDGRTLEAHRVRLDPGQERTFSVPISTDEGRLEAHLEEIRGDTEDARDGLATDNRAFAVIAPPRPIRVLLVGANPMVERALRSNERLELDVIGAQDFVDGSEHDLMIFEGNFPATIPQGRFLALAPPEGNPLVDLTGEALEGPRVATWDRGHPALFHVELGKVRFASAPRATPTRNLIPLAEFAGDDGPLLLAGRTPSWQGLVWTADLMESDFMLQVGFPVFLYNAIGWLTPGAERTSGRTVATGQALVVSARADDNIAITLPDQEQVPAQAAIGADGAYRFTETLQPGFYQITRAHKSGPREGETRETGFGVSLVNEQESTIAPASQVSLPRGGTVTVQQETQHVQEWLPWVLAGLLALLGAEWWLFLKRRSPG